MSSTGECSPLFTGIIETVGEVVTVDERGGGRTVEIAATFAGDLAPGQSVAVDGACLTVRAPGSGTFAVETGVSTLARTVAARYGPGSPVNLERAVRAGGRLDGHLVQGHVDGVANFLGHRRSGNTRLLDFELPADVFGGTVLHGSIALNGVSLTVNELLDGAVCQVAVIPYTWEHTNFFFLERGDAVNVEADLFGKYVRRIMETRDLNPGGRRNDLAI